MKTIPLDKTSTKLLGRSLVRNNILRLTLSCTGCEFVFTGNKLSLNIGVDNDCYTDGKRCNMPRIAIFCDNRIVVKKVIEKRSEIFDIICSDTTVTRTIKIIKLSEAAFSIAEVRPALVDDNASITPTSSKPLKIEFIGDSITCGYGVDDSNMQSEFACEAENGMKSYAYVASEILDADFSFFSYSGHGIISGFTDDGLRNTREILPPWYETYGFSYSSVDGIQLQDIPWNFNEFVPDIIVVNLGTNDNSFCTFHNEAYFEFERSYIDFLSVIRKNNPKAQIVCTLGIMLIEPLPYIENAVKILGDNKISIFKSSTQNGLLGFGSNWHPSEDTQRYAGEELAAYIKSIL